MAWWIWCIIILAVYCVAAYYWYHVGYRSGYLRLHGLVWDEIVDQYKNRHRREQG